jgi:hypothetical protein
MKHQSRNLVEVFKPIERVIRQAFATTDAVMRGRAVDTVQYELEELDHIFGVLVLGAFIGIPAPPIHITMDLLPLMERDLNLMLEKVSTAHDPLGDLFSVLEID